MLSVHTDPLGPLGTKDTGGMNVYIRELSRALGKKGMTVDVYTRCTDPCLPRVVPFGEQARLVRLQAGELAPLDKLAVFNHLPVFVCHLRHFAEEHELSYQFLHSHYWLSGWAGELLASRWNTPHLTMFHTLGAMKNRARPAENESWLRTEVEAKVLAAVDTVVAASEHERQEMAQLYGVQPRRIDVVPCGVDLRLFHPQSKEAARRALGYAEQRVLLFVGRMEPLKGVDLLIKAAALLPDLDDLRLVIIGGEEPRNGEMARLRALAHRLGIAHRVSFEGPLPQESLPVYYNAAEACVVPSYYESFGLVALEALACGTPVITSPVGGLTSFVRQGENGLFFGSRRPESLAQVLRWFLESAGLARTLARSARPSVLHLGWEAIADQIIALYREAASHRAPRQLCSCLR